MSARNPVLSAAEVSDGIDKSRASHDNEAARMSLSGDIDTAIDTIKAGSETGPATSETAATISTDRPAAASPPATSAPDAGSASGTASPVPSPAPATSASATADDGEPSGDGPIPLTRHQRILESARTKERERITSLYGVSPDDWSRHHLGAFAKTLLDNPVAAHTLLTQQLRAAGLLKNDPVPAPARAEAKPDDLPQPKLRADDGSLVYTADDTAKLIEHFVNKATASLRSELEPITSTHQQALARDDARRQIAEVQQYPHFETLKAEMVKLMKADSSLMLQAAYDRALRAYLPQIESSVRAKTLAEIKTAPAVPSQPLAPGSTVVRGASTTGKRRGLSWDEAAKQAVDAFHHGKPA
jgi:hypothetical protein